MKKNVFIILIIFLSLFFSNGVKALTMVDEQPLLHTCEYSTKDGKYTSKFLVYRSPGLEPNVINGGYPMTINKWDGSEVNKKFSFDSIEHSKSIYSTVFLTNTCPAYMIVQKKTFSYKGAPYYNLEEGKKNYDKKYAILYLLETSSLDKFNRIAGLSSYVNYLSEDYTKGQGNVTLEEKPYSCQYKKDESNNLTVEFPNSFGKIMYNYGSSFSYFEGASIHNIANMLCPSNYYEIIYREGGTGEKKTKTYNMSEWPDLCKETDYTCYRYTQNKNVEKYQKAQTPVKVEPVKLTATYYYYNPDIDLVYPSPTASVELSGKNDGTLENLVVKADGKRAFFVGPSDAIVKDYFIKILKNNTGLPSRIFCSPSIPEGYVKTTTVTNNTPTAGHTGIYCFTDYEGVGKDYKDYKIYVKDVDSEKIVSSNLAGDFTIGNDFPTKCKDKNTKECLAYLDEQYKETKRLVAECKNVYNDFNSTNADITHCDNLIKKIDEWAKAGYFGNRIIVTETKNDCENTLGALGTWLKTIYDIVKYAVPIVIVVLGIKDFITGTISGNDDALKKAGSTFVKRLLWGAVFIALPVLITMILTFAFGGDFADICIF